MALIHNFGEILFLPLAAITLLGRTIWTAVLAVLAGLGVISARSASTEDPSQYVTCYAKPREIVYFDKTEWQSSLLLRDWAKAERAIMYFAYYKVDDFKHMNELINTARSAYHSAGAEVGNGLLSKEAFDMAGDILSAWHREMALSYTSVECYEATMIQPTIEDVSGRLFSLQKLYSESKLTPASMEQAEQSIQSSLGSEMSPAVSAELSQLLVEMLVFGVVN